MNDTKTKHAPLKVAYMSFSIGYVIAAAKEEFEKRYGAKPLEWFFDRGLLKVGPVPNKQKVL